MLLDQLGPTHLEMRMRSLLIFAFQFELLHRVWFRLFRPKISLFSRTLPLPVAPMRSGPRLGHCVFALLAFRFRRQVSRNSDIAAKASSIFKNVQNSYFWRDSQILSSTFSFRRLFGSRNKVSNQWHFNSCIRFVKCQLDCFSFFSISFFFFSLRLNLAFSLFGRVFS